MIIKCPDKIKSFSCKGVKFSVDASGYIRVPDEMAPLILATNLGFSTATTAEVEGLKKQAARPAPSVKTADVQSSPEPEAQAQDDGASSASSSPEPKNKRAAVK